MGKHDADNRSNQMNPNNDAYWQSRGDEDRPNTWDETNDDSNRPENSQDAQNR